MVPDNGEATRRIDGVVCSDAHSKLFADRLTKSSAEQEAHAWHQELQDKQEHHQTEIL